MESKLVLKQGVDLTAKRIDSHVLRHEMAHLKAIEHQGRSLNDGILHSENIVLLKHGTGKCLVSAEPSHELAAIDSELLLDNLTTNDVFKNLSLTELKEIVWRE